MKKRIAAVMSIKNSKLMQFIIKENSGRRIDIYWYLKVGELVDQRESILGDVKTQEWSIFIVLIYFYFFLLFVKFPCFGNDADRNEFVRVWYFHHGNNTNG